MPASQTVPPALSRAHGSPAPIWTGTPCPVTTGRRARHHVRVALPHRSHPDVGVGVLCLLLSVVGAAWQLLDAPPAPDDAPSFAAMPLAASFAYGLTATVLAWLGRARVVRRVLFGIALVQALTTIASTYADAGLAAADPWPLLREVHWLASWLWAPGFVAVGLLLPLVLPDGRPLWRPAAVLSGVAVVWAGVSWALTPYHLQDYPTDTGLTNPVGIDAIAHPVVRAVDTTVLLLALVVALASVVVRWRRSRGTERDQLKWLLVGVLGTVAVGGAGILSAPPVAPVLSALAMLPFPIAVGIALVRHRLWDVDVVVSRSLAYALLTGAVVAGYVVAVALLGVLLGNSTGAPVLATALVALLVLPLHARLQRLVNRLVHGEADDPYTALARLGDRLESATDAGQLAEHVLPELVAKVARVVRVPYAAVTLADGTSTEHGDRPATTISTPLMFAGSEVGALVVAGDELPRADRRLLDQLARQAAVAVHSVLLARDVQRARTQTATAREEERRRLRRDLHDGMGPALAALALQAETARDLMMLDPSAATALLDRLVPRLNEAVADVRTLVHDLRPPTLDELGLSGALRELATRFTTPTRTVVVDAAALPPLAAAVDLAAYRIAAEALNNAVRHSDARWVQLDLSHRDGSLVLRVTDDGVGMRPDAQPGVGLRSMRERAEELGGSCVITPADDATGTALVVRIPLPRVDVAATPRVVVPAPGTAVESVPA
jgi:two-component system NarL family sensor kinase